MQFANKFAKVIKPKYQLKFEFNKVKKQDLKKYPYRYPYRYGKEEEGD